MLAKHDLGLGLSPIIDQVSDLEIEDLDLIPTRDRDLELAVCLGLILA